jgi:Mce-associated membrane protein
MGVACAVLGALVLALPILGTDLAARRSDERAIRAGSSQALAAADTALAAVFSYRWRSFAAHLGQVRGLLTPSFARSYLATEGRATEPTATRERAGVTAVVRKSALASAGSSASTVLIFLDEMTTTAGHPVARTSGRSLLVTVRRSGSTWLISGIVAK